MTLTIVFDNCSYESTPPATPVPDGLRTSWGFACWVETENFSVLFDTGGDGQLLLSNLAALGLEPRDLDAVVLSHSHGDHAGGLGALLATGITPTVYLPAAFPESYKADVSRRTELIQVHDAVEIVPGIRTTGELGDGMIEQALVLEAESGLVVLTGCAHPGVAQMVGRAIALSAREEGSGEQLTDEPVALVMGGFHLGSASQAQVEQIISAFREMGVQQVAPCHCTGDQARALFAQSYGEDCILAGVGYRTELTLLR